MRRCKGPLFVLFLAAVFVATLVALVPARAFASNGNALKPEYATWSDLSGKRVGLLAGAPFESKIREKCPNVGEILYYSTMSDTIAALRGKKIDALVNNEAVGMLASNRYGDITLFPEPLGEYKMGIAFPKGGDLASKFGKITDRLQSDGTADRLWDKWTSGDDSKKTLPEQDWAGSNGTLTVASCESLEPVSYLGDGRMMGYDIETLLICAKELDYRLNFEPMEFSDVLSYIQSGKADFGNGSILISDERKQAMDFAVTHENDLVLVVRATESAAAASDGSGSNWLDGIADSFTKTFVKDNRWIYIVNGLCVTAIITLCSGVLGAAIGFATVLLRRRGNRVVRAIIGGYEGLMNRLPIVVVLLVLYYVIFGSSDVSGTVVSIVAFTLAFGATAGSIMWNAVQAVDAGQDEASLALGFTERQTFFGVILPQAAHQFMPLLSGQFVNLTKQTSVVGYIAVMDLTRAADVIRSLTMEAFFPLFCIAAIYFALCCLIAAAMGFVIRRIDYERKPRTVRGVKL